MSGLGLRAEEWRLVVGGAVLWALAYPPFHLLLPSFLCLIPAVLLLAEGAEAPDPVRRWLVQGFWFGVVANLPVLHWVAVALWRVSPPAALALPAGLLVLGLLHAAVFALSGWVRQRLGVGLAVVFPLLWTAAEWTRGHLGDLRFPWLGLGTSLTGFPTLVQVAELVGARGVTYLLVLANAVLAVAWLRRRERWRSLGMLGGVLGGVALAAVFGVARERGLTLIPAGRVAALRTEIAPRVDWGTTATDSVVAELSPLARSAADGVDLVVWPEAALPARLPDPARTAAIEALVRETATPHLVGAYVEGREEAVFNAAVVVDPAGGVDLSRAHRKRYLVPVAERVPFVPTRWLAGLGHFGNTAPGPEAPVLAVGSLRFAVLVCFESAVERAARSPRARGAAFLVSVTNDAWVEGTAGVHQHEAHLIMRAIENRAGVVRAANGSPALLVDPLGRVRQRASDAPGFVRGTVLTTDRVPLYTRWGDWVGALAAALTLLLLGTAWLRRR